MIKINCKSCMAGNCYECNNENCLCRENHSKRELSQAFTNELNASMPQSIEELKASLKLYKEFDVDADKTINSDLKEFSSKDTRIGYDAYDEKNTAQHFSKDFVSDIMLPAHMFNGKESCGKWKLVGCLMSEFHKQSGGYLQKGIMRCNHKGCKVCASSAIKREAKSITDRLMTFCNLKKNRKVYLKKNRSRILSHSVISIPYEEQSMYLTREGRKKLRTKARNILKNFDIDGGVMVDHPYRFAKELESARLSPHIHLIITGWIDAQVVKQVYEKTGWIVSNLSTIDTWKDCYSLAKYLLSHSAVFMKEEGKRSSEHSVRWFGECHNSKFKVEEVLKYSETGYGELDKAILTRKEKTIKGIDYPLQSVSYTHTIIENEIKEVEQEYFKEYINGNPLAFSKSLKRFVTPHKDNPAFPQSEDETPSMDFLQMRFDYGDSQFDIVQSVYVNIILNHDIDCLCPECTLKMETLTPNDSGWNDEKSQMWASIIKDLPEGITMPFEDVSDFDYLKNTKVSHLGMPYFDLDGVLQYDSGIYQRPDCLDSLNPKLYWSIIKNINAQKAKFTFKLQNGRCPTKEELEEALKVQKPAKIDNSSI